MVLTKRFPSETFARALESWSWLDLAGKVPVLAGPEDAGPFREAVLADPAGATFSVSQLTAGP